MMISFNFIIVIISLLLVEFVSCQAPLPVPQAPKAPVNIIPKTIGTITNQPNTPTIPDSIAVPKGNNFAFLLYAKGNVYYKCIAASKQWLISNITANLINDINDTTQTFDSSFEIAQFYLNSPPINDGTYTWASLLPTDNSQVVAKFVANDTTASGTSSIPWELTSATFTGGSVRFSNVSYVLRVKTADGVAPSPDQCGVQYIDGTVNPFAYSAEYWFFNGPLPGSIQPATPPVKSEGYSTTNFIKSGQLSWVAIVGFVSVGVIFF